MAYNAFGFDALILMKQLKENGLIKFFEKVCFGFADPLMLARDQYSTLPNRLSYRFTETFNIF